MYFIDDISLLLKLFLLTILISSCGNRVDDYNDRQENIILEDTVSIERIKIPTH
tara:strand:- start:194 stop:355 length:162 start_codon:yes stop_codon:yes gene_type:complete